MKNRTIRFKITLWYAGALIILIGVIMLIVYLAGGMVLRNTIRDYLVSVVEVNSDEITFREEIDTASDPSDVYVRYGGGFLYIDDDFMNTVHDVRSAVYSGEGELLYGEDSLARVTESVPFLETRLWRTDYEGIQYNIYDRKLNLGLPEGTSVWLRGIVSEEDNVNKLNGIMRISFMIMPILMIIALLAGYFIAGRMLRPIRDLEQTAGRISRGSDLKQRIDVGEKNDELTALANVFNEMIGRLDKAFETERRFTSDASHELRTPMSVILAQSEYTLEKERTAEEYRDALIVIRRQSIRMNDLINDMLDYTRMDQSPDRYPMADTDLSHIVKDTAEQMKSLRTNNISLEYKVEPGIVIEGNDMLLARMLTNLISNAYRYGVENGHITVSLENEDRGGGRPAPVLTVSDDGTGIEQDEHDKIFERFYRSDSSRSVKGTGLGLSMVKKVAELHHAEIELESAPGEGSTFRIIFAGTDEPDRTQSDAMKA